jgi:hypothetical protein
VVAAETAEPFLVLAKKKSEQKEKEKKTPKNTALQRFQRRISGQRCGQRGNVADLVGGKTTRPSRI